MYVKPELRLFFVFVVHDVLTLTLLNPLPFKPPRCIKASFYIPENSFNFPATEEF